MADAVNIESIEFASVRVSKATEWTFAELFDEGGAKATVEITCGPNTKDAATRLTAMVAELQNRPISDESSVHEMFGLSDAVLQNDRSLATAVSGLRTAISILQAHRKGLSLTEQLGGTVQDSVQLYANINRSMLGKDRSPGSFGAVAERAARAGFQIVKCAPFDEVKPPSTPQVILEIAEPGLDRVAAVRDAVGPDIRVLVDCHSRFEVETAPLIAERLAELGVSWFEEPVQPTVDQKDLARIASGVTIPVAGGETGYGAVFFEELVTNGCVKTVMPDVKYCGGAAEACAAGRAAGKHAGRISLHSPSGPVSMLIGAHCTAAMPEASPLEHAVYEADWRAEVISPPERIEGGRLWIPEGKGLGAELNNAIIEKHGHRWKP